MNQQVKPAAVKSKPAFDWAHAFLLGLVLLGVLVVVGIVLGTIFWILG